MFHTGFLMCVTECETFSEKCAQPYTTCPLKPDTRGRECHRPFMLRVESEKLQRTTNSTMHPTLFPRVANSQAFGVRPRSLFQAYMQILMVHWLLCISYQRNCNSFGQSLRVGKPALSQVASGWSCWSKDHWDSGGTLSLQIPQWNLIFFVMEQCRPTGSTELDTKGYQWE